MVSDIPAGDRKIDNLFYSVGASRGAIARGLKLLFLRYFLETLGTRLGKKRYINDKGNHTDKKENEIFLIYKEIQMGSVAKSYIRKGFLIYEKMRKYLTIYTHWAFGLRKAQASIWSSNLFK